MNNTEEHLTEFTARLFATIEDIDNQSRFVIHFYSFKNLALIMENKSRYGPWFRLWATKVSKLYGKSFRGQAIFFNKGSYLRGKWYVYLRGEPNGPFGHGFAFMSLWPNKKYGHPEVKN